MRPINIIYFLLPFLATAQNDKTTGLEKELFICYGKIDPEMIIGYGLVIIETQHYTTREINIFKNNNEKVLGYISLTEVNETSFFYNEIKEYTFGKNKNWNSSYLNLSQEKCREVLFRALATIAGKGVDGFFMDNLDNVSQWGELTMQREDLVGFIKELKRRNKKLFLMQNAGMFLLKELEKTTNAILLESVITSYDFEKRSYTYREANEKKQILNQIKKIQKKALYIVEYAESKEMKEATAYQLKKIGRPYFIANIDLQTIPIFSSKN